MTGKKKSQNYEKWEEEDPGDYELVCLTSVSG